MRDPEEKVKKKNKKKKKREMRTAVGTGEVEVVSEVRGRCRLSPPMLPDKTRRKDGKKRLDFHRESS